MVFTGSIVALVTPMDSSGAVDESRLEGLINFHLEAGTEAFVIAGTTGESATLSKDEHIFLIQRACELVDSRVPVIAGTGSNSTSQTLDLSIAVDSLPISGFLVVTPYYNKPTQRGMIEHFSVVADSVEKPVLLYNVPGRTGVDLLPDTVTKLSAHDNIVGIKEATGDLKRVQSLRNTCGSDFSLLSGDDITACDFMLRGGDGVISVTANVAPQAMRLICDAARSGNHADAEMADEQLRSLHDTLFIESNPIPVKWAMMQLKLVGDGIRLPLTTLNEEHHNILIESMVQAGIEVNKN
ncbi:MAG: 4-hydroxy-tetrahydrodipicolinate synthase [Rhodospirillaceae bacterium]|nr:4-hydroxy-tetrahydrodipicolinate synthase [Rhodospirillaceae bacterium]|tara:strand:+ start:1921 stop:2811 length:891 start_codon:yes stop_codon:yes gene_type:complete